jgi:hypothetical protein
VFLGVLCGESVGAGINHRGHGEAQRIAFQVSAVIQIAFGCFRCAPELAVFPCRAAGRFRGGAGTSTPGGRVVKVWRRVQRGETCLPILEPIVFWRERKVRRGWKTLLQGVAQAHTCQKTLFCGVGDLGTGWKTLFRREDKMATPRRTLFRKVGKVLGGRKTLFQGGGTWVTRRTTPVWTASKRATRWKTLFRGRGTFPSAWKRVF